jgi:hypothetical protein
VRDVGVDSVTAAPGTGTDDGESGCLHKKSSRVFRERSLRTG